MEKTISIAFWILSGIAFQQPARFQKAWPLLRKLLNDTKFRDRLDVTMAEIMRQS
jgi:hypothetical protein